MYSLQSMQEENKEDLNPSQEDRPKMTREFFCYFGFPLKESSVCSVF